MSQGPVASPDIRPRTVWPVRAYNTLAGLASRPRPITVEQVVRQARRMAGRDDVDRGIETPLRILTESFDREGKLHAFGRQSAFRFLAGLLARRANVIEALERHPEAFDQEIRRPLFVIGAPRTGTTMLLNLLARDRRARPLLSWEGAGPAPPSSRRWVDPRIGRAKVTFAVLRYLAPGLDAIHEVRAENPGEDIGLLQNTLVSWVFLILADLPSYERWLWEQPDETYRNAYGFYRKQLQLLQWQRSGEHWVLKSPAHLQSMGPLFEVFPDACVVQTHRDPAKVLPSSCSLFASIRGIMSDAIDPHALGRAGLEGGARAAERMLELRERLSAERVLDVQYADLVADPLATVHRIYAHFGYEMTTEMGRAMQGWLRDNPRHKHGAHRYTLGQFGLDADEVRSVYRKYIDRFDVPAEG